MSEMKAKIFPVFRAVLYLIYGCALCFLFSRQANGTYPSDLGTHITSAISGDSQAYTIIKPIFRFLYGLTGNSKAIFVFLALAMIATIELTYRMIVAFSEAKSRTDLVLSFGLAVCVNFAISIYIPWIQPFFNLGLPEGNEWHNSTYILMRLLGLLVLAVYWRIEKNYQKKINIGVWCTFLLLLILVNMIKPNFLMVFAPTMLLFLIGDFVQTRGQSVKANILFGLPVLISMAVLLYQYKVLFVSDESSGIGIGFAVVWSYYNPHYLIGIVQGLAFPLYIFITNFKKITQNRNYLFAYVMVFVGLLEYLLLYETGSRMYDANFDWGLSFSVFISFLMSSAVYATNMRDVVTKKKNIGACLVGTIILIAHVVCGIIYFGRIIMGQTYY